MPHDEFVADEDLLWELRGKSYEYDGRTPPPKDIRDDPDTPTYAELCYRFGSYADAAREAGLLYPPDATFTIPNPSDDLLYEEFSALVGNDIMNEDLVADALTTLSQIYLRPERVINQAVANRMGATPLDPE